MLAIDTDGFPTRRHADRLCAQALVRVEGGRVLLLYSYPGKAFANEP